jgi:hypothetical protein
VLRGIGLFLRARLGERSSRIGYALLVIAGLIGLALLPAAWLLPAEQFPQVKDVALQVMKAMGELALALFLVPERMG